MSQYVEIKFKGRRTAMYWNKQGLPLKRGDLVIVEADKGVDLGQVNLLIAEMEAPEDIKQVVRKAGPDDLLRHRQNRINEVNALELCRQKVKKHKLDMHLVDCEYQLDGNKITFYFTADQRVDFRGLVKDLAAQYRTRIELRQIGVRDAAKRLGGFGVCGREMCCVAFIRQFIPISTQAAKDQNLPLNPNRLAGVCGRLKCCLMYERDFYNWAINKYPHLAKEVETDKGHGVIQRVDILREEVIVRYDSGEIGSLPLNEVQQNLYHCQNPCGRDAGSLEDLGPGESLN